LARHKVLKGVVYSLGHSFASCTNHMSDDYVLGHLLRFARRTGTDALEIDLLAGVASPPQLLEPPIRGIGEDWARNLRHLVEVHGSDMRFVRSARLSLQFDLTQTRRVEGFPQFLENPYICRVELIDDTGKEYTARFEGWWFPEV
jgi:hypothetical protein